MSSSVKYSTAKLQLPAYLASRPALIAAANYRLPFESLAA